MTEIGPKELFFNQQNNIKYDAITLALHILKMNNVEFTSLSLDKLIHRKLNTNNGLTISALNILIFYKSESSNNFLPKQHKQNIFNKPSFDPSFDPFNPSFDPFNKPLIDPSFDPSFEPQTDQFNKLDQFNKQFI
jgi:hypothetical protein